MTYSRAKDLSVCMGMRWFTVLSVVASIFMAPWSSATSYTIYPQGRRTCEATDPERLWKILAEQRDVWTTTPSDRFNHGLYCHPDPSRNGLCSNVPGGHFLHRNPGFFDTTFFNMTHAEATALDPQQRIVLECAYEAVENAGIPLEKLIGSNTAVFVGSSCRDYADIMASDLDRTELYQSTGTGQTMLSNRISYFFDLKGPSASNYVI
ncbi:beta-ketoacyl synthase [Lipomyces mesembrius]